MISIKGNNSITHLAFLLCLLEPDLNRITIHWSTSVTKLLLHTGRNSSDVQKELARVVYILNRTNCARHCHTIDLSERAAKSPKFQEFWRKHCISAGKYVIVLAKCGDRSCCNAPRLPQPLFKQFTDIGWVYPVQSDDPEHYIKFVDAFDNRESRQENCLPAAVSTKKKHPFSLVQGRARAVIFVLWVIFLVFFTQNNTVWTVPYSDEFLCENV